METSEDQNADLVAEIEETQSVTQTTPSDSVNEPELVIPVTAATAE